MRRSSILLAAVLLVVIAPPSPAGPATSRPSATDPDFYLLMDRCKTTIAYHVVSDQSLKLFDDDPVSSACERRSNRISCALVAKDGGPMLKGNWADYALFLDAPPLLHFGMPNGAEFVTVDTTQHTVVIISRVVDTKFAGSKVCWGRFATESERKLLLGEQ